MTLSLREELALQKQETEEQEASLKAHEKEAAELVRDAIARSRASFKAGFVVLPKSFPHTDYKSTCTDDDCKDKENCFVLNCIQTFDPNRLQGLAKLVHYKLSSEPLCFIIEIVDDSDKHQNKFRFKIRWV